MIKPWAEMTDLERREQIALRLGWQQEGDGWGGGWGDPVWVSDKGSLMNQRRRGHTLRFTLLDHCHAQRLQTVAARGCCAYGERRFIG